MLILIKNEIIEELKNIKDNDLEDMVFRKDLAYNKIEKIVDMK